MTVDEEEAAARATAEIFWEHLEGITDPLLSTSNRTNAKLIAALICKAAVISQAIGVEQDRFEALARFEWERLRNSMTT